MHWLLNRPLYHTTTTTTAAAANQLVDRFFLVKTKKKKKKTEYIKHRGRKVIGKEERKRERPKMGTHDSATDRVMKN